MKRFLTELDCQEFTRSWLKEHPKNIYFSLLEFLDNKSNIETGIKQIALELKTIEQELNLPNHSPIISVQVPNALKEIEYSNVLPAMTLDFQSIEYLSRNYDYKDHSKELETIQDRYFLTYNKCDKSDKQSQSEILKVYRSILFSINDFIELVEQQKERESKLSEEIQTKINRHYQGEEFNKKTLDPINLTERIRFVNNLLYYSTHNKENTFNNLPIKEVREFFKSLHTEVNMKGEKFLTKEQFEKFISRAFQGNKTITPIKLNIQHGDKTRVQYLFFQFKEYCEGITGTNNEKYITLLTDNFIQYEFQKVKNNFDKEPDKIYQLPNPLNT